MSKPAGYLSFCLFVALVAPAVLAQPVRGEFPDTLWAHTFGGDASDVGFSIERTPDGGFVVAGYATLYETGEDGYLIRLTAEGETLWTRRYGGPEPDRFQSVQLTSGGGFIAAGTTESSGHGYEDVWLVRVDADGDTLWTRTFGGARWDEGWCVQETRDGGYIVVGHESSFSGCDWDIYVVRTDAQGREVWNYEFPGYDNYWDYGYGVVEAQDGGFVVVGASAMNVGTEFDLLVLKLDGSGQHLWVKTYGTYGQEYGTSVCRTRDGCYVVAGHRWDRLSSYVRLFKVNDKGDSLWCRSYAESDYVRGHCVHATADGGFLVAGHAGSYVNPDAYLLRTDESGIPLWQGKIDNGGDEVAYGICPTGADGCCVVGTNEPSQPGPTDLWVLRLEPGACGIAGIARATSCPWVLSPVSPSPVLGEAAVFLQMTGSDPAALNLYDVSGRLIRRLWQGKGSTGQVQVSLDRRGLAGGVYFLRLQGGAGSVTQRCVLAD